MATRVGKVTAAYPATGKVKVTYEDTGNTSLALSMLTMNSEYSMPSVGDRVVTLHMENGSSKGFVLGTYYGGGTTPRAAGGYRKDFSGGAYIVCDGGVYDLSAAGISLETGGITLKLEESDLSLEAAGTVDMKGTDILAEAEGTFTLKGSGMTLESEGEITLSGASGSIALEELINTLKDYEERISALEGGA